MKQLFFILLIISYGCSVSPVDVHAKKYAEQASRVTIIRDKWGIPHVYGKTDADAVFGLMYAQCEDSFERLERNYIKKFGRMAEVEGPAYLYEDLRMKLIYDTSAAIADYKKSPAWLLKLLNAFADGINYYLYKHPEAKPLLLTHFEPWFPLMLTDGAYVATVDGGLQTKDIQNLYGKKEADESAHVFNIKITDVDAAGSNGFALGSAKTASKNAILYVNPHVTFDFRMEAHIVSEEGLNVYGAVTWGQFFVFQGFNEHCGWMHTSSQADASDLYEETIVKKGDSLLYQYDNQLRNVSSKQLVLKYNKFGMHSLAFTVYATHHGPVMGSRNNKWLSLKERNRTLNGLIQSWQRTKAVNFKTFKEAMGLRANNSTNTVYADDSGNIAYWHGNFIPVRTPGYDYSQPVPGNITATEWKGTHEVDELVHILNPPGGWLQNCNSTPFSAAGINSLNPNDYPAYMAPEGENFRSWYAIHQLERRNNFTIDSLAALGTSPYLSAFDSLLPPLLDAFNALPLTDDLYGLLKGPVLLLKEWDKSANTTSVATTIATLWAYTLLSNNAQKVLVDAGNNQVDLFTSIVKNTPASKRLELLRDVINGLQRVFGKWEIPFGDINRFQRISGSVSPEFDDSKPSRPVGFASSIFGSLPAYETDWGNNKKGYGVAGNSFIAVVEFGKRIKAKSVVAGGQSFIPGSKHFTDQEALFTEGKFKDVLFYKEDVLKQMERLYHPGE